MLILASGSPRRSELLRTLLGDDFLIEPPDVDETVHGVDPIAEAVQVAARKAAAVHGRHPGEVVLGADTTLAVDGRSLGQAASSAEARNLLDAVSDRRCLVTTGLALRSDSFERGGAVTAAVELRALSDHDLDTYLASDAWRGKAGALEVQGAARDFVREIVGCRGTVIGLPVCEVARLLEVDDPCASGVCVAGA